MAWRRDHWDGADWEPRAWQREALPEILTAIGGEHPVRGLVQAVMGAGKSVLLAEICRAYEGEPDDVIVVTTSTTRLVEQLADTIGTRVGVGNVGLYYTFGKSLCRVIVACTPSAGALARDLADAGQRCGLWIADEAHRTECGTIAEAYAALEPRFAIGFTATPYRGTEAERLSLWDRVIYEYGVSDALRDGVIVPFQIVPWEGVEVPLDEACVQMIKREIEREEYWPGIVNARNIDDAESFANVLGDAGIRSRAIHSKLSRRDQTRLVRDVRAGELDCLVHVSLLQEGVDFPWLRWLCLRRATASRVRFAQEVGRVLRAAPGKDRAWILDPLDLFGELKLSYEAALGYEPASDTVERHPADSAADELMQVALDLSAPAYVRYAKSVEPVRRYLSQLAIAFDLAGLVEKGAHDGRWRHEFATAPQVKAIEKLTWTGKFVPEPHRETLKRCIWYRKYMTRGEASYLLDVLVGLARARRWPDLAGQLADPAVEAA